MCNFCCTFAPDNGFLKKMHNEINNMKWWHAAIIVLLSVAVAALFSSFLNSDFSSMEMFVPFQKKVDFRVTDIYNMMAEEQSEREMSENVVVVGIDSLNREQVLTLIDTILLYEPIAIGLDIYFSIDKADNTALMHTVENTPNMVNIIMVEHDKDRIHYIPDTLSFFYRSLTTVPHSGFANLDVDHSWTVVRTFLPYVCTSAGDTIPNIALELAKIADPEKAQEAVRRGRSEEIIDFTHSVIDTISAERLANPDVAERMRGKVVLIGVLKDPKDTYLTPLSEPAPGVLIHAYATQTILQGQYIETRPEWINWTVAVCLCLILICLLLWANESEKIGYAINLTTRVLMFVSLFILVYIGCRTFAQDHIYADYTPAITMLVFGMFAFDIVYAGYGLCRQLVLKKQTNSLR